MIQTMRKTKARTIQLLGHTKNNQGKLQTLLLTKIAKSHLKLTKIKPLEDNLKSLMELTPFLKTLKNKNPLSY